MGHLAVNINQSAFSGYDQWPAPARRVPLRRKRRGQMAALAGNMAEEIVTAQYQANGYCILARRWRGKAGEIDLICERDDCLIFVEVKRSRTHAQAGARLQRAQMDRICLAACEFCADRRDGLLSEMRFDAALVDEAGRIDVIENAFGE